MNVDNPPHAQWDQAKAVMKALGGDPDADADVRQAASQGLPGWLPGEG